MTTAGATIDRMNAFDESPADAGRNSLRMSPEQALGKA